MKTGAKTLAKGAANPLFIAGDVAEIAVEKLSGSKTAGRASSLAIYVGGGAAVGGPAGAAVGAAMWGVSQVFDLIFD